VGIPACGGRPECRWTPGRAASTVAGRLAAIPPVPAARCRGGGARGACQFAGAVCSAGPHQLPVAGRCLPRRIGSSALQSLSERQKRGVQDCPGRAGPTTLRLCHGRQRTACQFCFHGQCLGGAGVRSQGCAAGGGRLRPHGRSGRWFVREPGGTAVPRRGGGERGRGPAGGAERVSARRAGGTIGCGQGRLRGMAGGPLRGDARALAETRAGDPQPGPGGARDMPAPRRRWRSCRAAWRFSWSSRKR